MNTMEPYPVQRLMTEGAWMLFVTMLLIGIEVLAARAGLLISAGFLLAFFLSVTYSWRSGLLWGGIACVCAEILLGRRATLLPLLPLVVWGARAWRQSGDCSLLLSQLLPGGLIGLAYGISVVLLENSGLATMELYISVTQMLMNVVKAVLGNAVLLPLLVGGLDFLAARLEINQYHRRARLSSGSQHDN